MKYATTLDEHVDKLKNRGLVINDEEKAKEVLLDIGYYRFGAYLFPFEKKYPSKKNRDHLYKDGTDFYDALDLYYFDCDLRRLLMKYLTRIEETSGHTSHTMYQIYTRLSHAGSSVIL